MQLKKAFFKLSKKYKCVVHFFTITFVTLYQKYCKL